MKPTEQLAAVGCAILYKEAAGGLGGVLSNVLGYGRKALRPLELAAPEMRATGNGMMNILRNRGDYSKAKAFINNAQQWDRKIDHLQGLKLPVTAPAEGAVSPAFTNAANPAVTMGSGSLLEGHVPEPQIGGSNAINPTQSSPSYNPGGGSRWRSNVQLDVGGRSGDVQLGINPRTSSPRMSPAAEATATRNNTLPRHTTNLTEGGNAGLGTENGAITLNHSFEPATATQSGAGSPATATQSGAGSPATATQSGAGSPATAGAVEPVAGSSLSGDRLSQLKELNAKNIATAQQRMDAARSGMWHGVRNLGVTAGVSGVGLMGAYGLGRANSPATPATGQQVIAQSPAAQQAQFTGAPMSITPGSTSQSGTPSNAEMSYTPGQGMPLWMNSGQPQQADNTQPPGFLATNQVSQQNPFDPYANRFW